MDDILSPKDAWLGHVNRCWAQTISLEQLIVSGAVNLDGRSDRVSIVNC